MTLLRSRYLRLMLFKKQFQDGIEEVLDRNRLATFKVEHLNLVADVGIQPHLLLLRLLRFRRGCCLP